MRPLLMFKRHNILFALGIGGIVFYAIGPLLFPHASLRMPELLPVYTTFLGVGQVLKGSEEKKQQNGS